MAIKIDLYTQKSDFNCKLEGEGRRRRDKVLFKMSPLKETEQMYFPPSYIHEMTASLPRSTPPSAPGSEPAQPLSGTRQGKKKS